MQSHGDCQNGIAQLLIWVTEGFDPLFRVFSSRSIAVLGTSRLHWLYGNQADPDLNLQRSAKTIDLSPSPNWAGSHMTCYIAVVWLPGAQYLPAGAVPCSLHIHSLQNNLQPAVQAPTPCGYRLMQGTHHDSMQQVISASQQVGIQA